MKLILPKPGRYLVAVSGGLDSVCLLHMLVTRPEYELSVAHFDHGIRPDSSIDRDFVEGLANLYNLPFISGTGQLGPNTSEAVAREARYNFLLGAMQEYGLDALITAHHQDDRLETLVINLVRGTGRRGISSIGESEGVKRPLLKVGREELKAYALEQGLVWREDPTNSEDKYLRNYIRHNILPKLSLKDKQRLVGLMNRQVQLNVQIDELVLGLLDEADLDRLSLKTLNNLPFRESRELVVAWLRQNQLSNFNRQTIERLTVAAKTKQPGTRIDIYGQATAVVEKGFLALYDSER